MEAAVVVEPLEEPVEEAVEEAVVVEEAELLRFRSSTTRRILGSL